MMFLNEWVTMLRRLSNPQGLGDCIRPIAKFSQLNGYLNFSVEQNGQMVVKKTDYFRLFYTNLALCVMYFTLTSIDLKAFEASDIRLQTFFVFYLFNASSQYGLNVLFLKRNKAHGIVNILHRVLTQVSFLFSTK